MNIVVGNIAGEEVCRFGSQLDSSLGDILAAIQDLMGEPLDDGHVLLQGTRVLTGGIGDEESEPLIGAAFNGEEKELRLTLVLQQRPAVRKALSEMADCQLPRSARMRALKTLRSEARPGDAETVQALVALVRDEKCSLIRLEAAGALETVAKGDDEGLMDAWVALSEHHDLYIQKRAVQALFRLRRSAAAEASE